ncbi:hypothetical protein Cri9333_4911 (plasmid) [Crinalium epipsammum PCC 9333]|uniref:Uncharacterized protein n=1 Tax=Crinalium epipsammum PCC 9333 TaxID=1173022 RepID=K9W7F4_9CYAN|nr:hypothetical protein [Crinalium epipsammum]AFZ15672.1 hypothetical protein Cri9333_4911 [Crinalium epipsammum PCC 9333]
MHRPSSMTEQQRQQIYSFIYSKIRIKFQEFLSRWDVTHDFIADLYHCDVTTVRSWINKNFGDSASQRSHQFKLFIADLILSDFEGLPDNLKILFCPDWNR